MSSNIPTEWCPDEPAEGHSAYPTEGGSVPNPAEFGARRPRCVEWTPSRVTASLVDMLRGHFASSRRWVMDESEAVWKPQQSEIYISTSGAWARKSESNLFPAIVVKRQPYRTQTLSINDNAGTDKEGFENYTNLLVGSHSLFCLAKPNDLAAERLAEEVWAVLQVYQQVALRRLQLHYFKPAELGDPARLAGQNEDVYAVPVTAAVGISQRWRIREDDALILSGFNFTQNG